jgi:hypothetical protein
VIGNEAGEKERWPDRYCRIHLRSTSVNFAEANIEQKCIKPRIRVQWVQCDRLLCAINLDAHGAHVCIAEIPECMRIVASFTNSLIDNWYISV